MTLTSILLEIVFSSIPAIAFAILFATPKKYLPFVALGGIVAHLTRTISIECFGLQLEYATFIASITISLMFIYIGPKIKVPRPVFTVASIIPIIPGKLAYLTLLNLINLLGEPDQRLNYMIKFFETGTLSAAVLLAIGMGIALPPLFFYKNKPVV